MQAIQESSTAFGGIVGASSRREPTFAPFLTFFLLAGASFAGLFFLVPESGPHLSSLVAQAFAVTCVWMLEEMFPTRDFEPPAMTSPHAHSKLGWNLWSVITRPVRIIRDSRDHVYWKEAFVVVLANAALGIVLLAWLVRRVDFTALSAAAQGIPVSRVFFLSSVLNILTVQVGGWPLQAFLVFCLVTILNGSADLGFYVRLVGLAYVGYLLLTIALALVNPVMLPAGVGVNEVNALTQSIHPLMGKLAELWVLTLLAYGVAVREKFGLLKSLAAAIGPGFLLLSTKLAYDLFT